MKIEFVINYQDVYLQIQEGHILLNAHHYHWKDDCASC